MKPDLDIVVQSPLWARHPDAASTIERAVVAAAEAVPARGELAILLADDSAVRALNRQWRGLDKPTNVLSFPAAAPEATGACDPPMGDIVIAYETVAREAEAEGKPLMNHLAHLVVHGLLHLAGYDHADDHEAEIMEHVEIEILAQLGIANPYLERAETAS